MPFTQDLGSCAKERRQLSPSPCCQTPPATPRSLCQGKRRCPEAWGGNMTEFGGPPCYIPLSLPAAHSQSSSTNILAIPRGTGRDFSWRREKAQPLPGLFPPSAPGLFAARLPPKMWLGYSVQGQKGPKAYTPEKEIHCLRQQETFVPVLTSGCRTTLTLCNRHQSPSPP